MPLPPTGDTLVPVPEQAFDPHHVLEIDEGASAATIRRAYRRQAMRWHPDRNPDPHAAERFKQIRAAYERLTETQDGDEAGEPPGEADEPAPRGADRHEEIWLTLEEAMLGCDKPFAIVRESECASCAGTGSIALTHTRLCGDCHGSGRVRNGSGLARCASCGGQGYVLKAPCEACEGSGVGRSEQQVTVHVASGVLPGEVLRLKGLGHPPEGDGLPGVLYLTIRLHPDPLFRLDGRDLHVDQPIGMLRLLVGGRISVAGPLGPILVDLDRDAADCRRVRLEGRGFPGRNGALDTAGALEVHFQPRLPLALSPAQLQRLAALETELQADGAGHYPEVHDWWQAYRDR